MRISSKTFVLPLLLAPIINIAHAASPSLACEACEISIPKYAGGIYIAVEALYYAVDIEDTAFALSYHTQAGVDTYRTHNVDSEVDWGYSVTLGKNIAGTGNDFRISWTDIKWTAANTVTLPDIVESNTTLAAFVPGEWEPFGDITDQAVESTYVKGSYDVEHHKIDLEAAQSIKIGHDSVVLRFHGGIRYAEIDTKFSVHYDAQDLVDFVDLNGAYSAVSDFNGLGPRMGIDGTWHVTPRFSLIANAAVSFLIGDVSTREKNVADGIFLDIALFGNLGNEIGEEAYRESHDHQVVPVMDLRLGAGYQPEFGSSHELGLQVGYQSSHYFDIDHRMSSPGTDISYDGLYCQLSFVI